MDLDGRGGIGQKSMSSGLQPYLGSDSYNRHWPALGYASSAVIGVMSVQQLQA
jgi:hypothetical protein